MTVENGHTEKNFGEPWRYIDRSEANEDTGYHGVYTVENSRPLNAFGQDALGHYGNEIMDDHQYYNTALRPEDAKRSVECVNALAGWDIEAVKVVLRNYTFYEDFFKDVEVNS